MSQVQKGAGPTDRYAPIRPRSSSSWTIPVVVLITVIFVIYGIIHYFMNTEPYRLSETFIRQNQTIKAEIGDVDKCHPWFPIEMDPLDRNDGAKLTFDVTGAKGSTEVLISLQRRQGQWRVVSASYKDRQGFLKSLVQEDQTSTKGKIR
jgi:hypothetical protein